MDTSTLTALLDGVVNVYPLTSQVSLAEPDAACDNAASRIVANGGRLSEPEREKSRAGCATMRPFIGRRYTSAPSNARIELRRYAEGSAERENAQDRRGQHERPLRHDATHKGRQIDCLGGAMRGPRPYCWARYGMAARAASRALWIRTASSYGIRPAGCADVVRTISAHQGGGWVAAGNTIETHLLRRCVFQRGSYIGVINQLHCGLSECVDDLWSSADGRSACGG